MKEKETLGIYIHIPFCKSKCGYCDFCSNPPASAQEIERYQNALMLHMQDLSAAAADYTVDTVYFGGGTPTMLSAKQLCALLDCVRDSFTLEKDAEITTEANPGTVDRRALRALRKCGFNRISFGLQSADDAELRALGRVHTAADLTRAYDDARRAGFMNISLDLMYGIPRQTRESFRRSLDFARGLDPEHLSVYGLKIEEGTPFYAARECLSLPDEESEYNMYFDAHRVLGEAGYEHYEISNFARRGFRSRHNLRYWLDEKYLGFGVSAHSYFNNQRYAYTTDIDAYIREMESPTELASILTECTDIDVFTKETEYVMLRLRLFDGISLPAYRAEFGRDFLAKYGKKLERYLAGGFARAAADRIALTAKGMYVSNYILSDLLDF